MLDDQTGGVLTGQASGAWLYWWPVVCYAGLIFYLSSLSDPGAYLPEMIGVVSDKILHAAEYGILGLLCYRAFRYAAGTWAARYAVMLAITASTAYGLSDELHQAFVPLREVDGWDLLMDFVGSSIGAYGWARIIDVS